MATIETAWRNLTAALEGEVVLPGSPRYDEVRRPQIPRFHDVRPQAVVLCRTPEDVVEAIAFARRSGIEVAVRSGGHDFAGRSSGPGMVLDLTPMQSLEVSDGLATVGPGFRLGDLYAALAQHEVTIPAGCGATVGIGGQALGGGLGLLGRSRGLTSDQVVAATVVLADGRVVECDEQRYEDLFWALRGAGAQGLGVVTSLTLRAVPEPAATSFHLEWPYEHASVLVATWQEWSPMGPDELAASLLVTVGGEPGADPVVHLFGSMIGSETETAALLDEFVSIAGADPASSERAHMRYGSLKAYLAERGPGDQGDEDGRPYMKSEFFREPLPADVVEALLELFVRGRRPGEARKLDFMPWGGAYNRVPADATAFPHREELFLLEHSVVVPAGFDAAATEAARAWLSDSWDLVHPSGSGGVYANFPDTDLPDEQRAYWGANLERVRRVKEKYDPERVFG
ncbi:MAG TPA: FAD-binding oxidoreductase [Thermoleophilaceae bacterium]|nr:FAD-binding oxidoreductase [Thermoleophilaceae bacterium]